MNDTDRAREALHSIDADCSRDEWVRLGMAAKAAGLQFDDFLGWSETAANFGGEADCKAVWRSFKADGGVSSRTLFKAAHDAGWREPNGHVYEPPKRPQATRRTAGKPCGSTFDFAAVWRDSEAATARHGFIGRKLGLPDGLRVYRGPLTVAGQALDGALLVPIHNAAGALQSWQAIPAEPGGRKLNAPGASVRGGSLIVGGTPREALYLVEGIGAAWSAHQASRRPAVCCFAASNLEPVAAQMRARFPRVRLIVVCDRGKEDLGERIARAVGGAWIALPHELPANADINDVHIGDGLAAVESLLAQERTPVEVDEPLAPEFSDDALALEFVAAHGAGMRWTPGMDWMRDEGTHWQPDAQLRRYDLARQVCRAAAGRAESRPEQKRLAAAGTVNATLTMARSDRRIVVPADAWDADPLVLNTPAGIVDLRNGACARGGPTTTAPRSPPARPTRRRRRRPGCASCPTCSAATSRWSSSCSARSATVLRATGANRSSFSCTAPAPTASRRCSTSCSGSPAPTASSCRPPR